ncbi:MAG: methyltransferase [Epsilonproteobacteria bacterium]|nr:methyltransferase [Campylobacterota bacterium]
MTLLYQPIDGYCYNSDTLALFNFIKENLKIFKNNQGELLDIGSGSGILGILIAKEYQKLKLHSAEIQEEFIFLTKKNSQINGVISNIYEGDFQHLSFEKSFDMIVSNPPFYPSSVIQSDNKNLKRARYNDSLPLEFLIQKSSKILKDNGKFFFCYDVKLLDDIIFFSKKYGINIEALQFLHPKIDRKSSLVMVYGRKNSKSLLSILPPLVMFEGEKFTKEMEDIYKMCNTYSIKVDTKQL